MANENKALDYLTDDLFNQFCRVAVLEVAADVLAAAPTSVGRATFAMFATSRDKMLEEYTQALAKGLIGLTPIQVHAAASDTADMISWATYIAGAEIFRDEVWIKHAEVHPDAIPGTP